jgi:hypothetical protein
MLAGGFDLTQKIRVYGGKAPRQTRLTLYASDAHNQSTAARLLAPVSIRR